MLNQIVCGDFLKLLPDIPDNTFDLTITSPPYFQQRKYTNDVNEIGNEDELDFYIEKIISCFKECVRVTKSTGSIIFNIGDKCQNSCQLLIPYRFAIKALEIESVKLINEITWKKTNPTPKPCDKRLLISKEPFFHFVKSSQYYYNKDHLSYFKNNRPAGQNTGKKYFKLIEESNLTSEEKKNAIKDLNEVIDEVKNNNLHSFRMKIRGIHAPAFGGQQGGRNNQIKNKGYTIIKIHGKNQVTDVFENAVETIKGNKHPAVYPVALIEKLIMLTTKENDFVFDPFMGSGTTAVAAKKINRNYFGIELSEDFVKIAKKRLL